MASHLSFYLSLVAWLSSPASSTGLPAGSPGKFPKSSVSAGTAEVYHLGSGLRAAVQGHDLVITDGVGAVMAHTSHLIRLEDERSSCPSEGFERIVSKGDYFTIEQQTCGGWYFVHEYITFHYLKASRQIVLHKYGRVSVDRRAPDKIIPAELYTAKQLGLRSFSQVTKASLDAVGY